MDRQLSDLIEIIHFTENLSTKVHGVLDEAEIYRILKEEFAKSKRYDMTIFLLTDDGSKVRIVETSVSPRTLMVLEKAAGLKMSEYKIDLKKSSIFNQVITEGETVQVNFSDLVGDFLPRPLAYLVAKTLRHKKKTILTPLYRWGRIIGAFGTSSPELVEHFIPSVRNLAQQISVALELVDENTERKKMEERLRESEEKFRSIVETIPECVYNALPNGEILYMSPAAETIFGFSAEEFVKDKELWIRLIHEEDKEELLKKLEELLKKGLSSVHEFRMRRKDGDIVWVRDRAEAVLDEKGKPLKITGIVYDITESKRMENELVERARLLDAATDSIFLRDLDGNLIYVNEAAYRTRGYSRDELLKMKMRALIASEYAKRYEQRSKELLEKGEASWESAHIRKDKSIMPVEVHARVIEAGGRKLVLSVIRDTTERKKAEGELIRLSSAVRMSTDSIVISDMNGRIIDANEATLKMYGTNNKEDLIGKSSFDLIAPEDRGRALMGMKETLEKGYIKNREYNIITRADDRFPVEMSAAILKDMEGKPVGFVGISRDITERKRMEEEIRNLARFPLENPNPILCIRADGTILYTNPAAKSLLNAWKSGIGQHAPENWRRLVADTLALGPKKDVELEHGGKVFSFMLLPVTDNACVNVYGRDISDRKRMEEKLRGYSEHLEELVEEKTRELRKAERLATIGEISSMIGHDLRNPLQALTNAVYLLKESGKEVETTITHYGEHKGVFKFMPKLLGTQISQNIRKLLEKRREIVQIIDESVNYANKMISDLQDYSRPVTPQLSETSLHQLITQTLSTIEIPEAIRVSVVVEEGFPQLVIDPQLMRRVFTNLITNAFQAMPHRGQLTIRATKTEEAAFISFQDTGVGIPKENLTKLFRPLFTTKSKGMGFGLAICQRMVEAHGGNITVESEVDKGSTFTIKIPLKIPLKGGELE